MEVKKRITIKKVSEDFSKDLENIKENIKTSESRLEAYEEKVKSLEEEKACKDEVAKKERMP